MYFSYQQIHILTDHGYYYDWTVTGNTFVGRSILNGVRWRIVSRGNDIFDMYVMRGMEWKKPRSVIDVASTYAVLSDYEDIWCKHHPEPQKRI